MQEAIALILYNDNVLVERHSFIYYDIKLYTNLLQLILITFEFASGN
jgi:hypothetical protein